MTNDATTTKRPVAGLRDGRLKATIWANAGEKGTFHSVRFSRTWKDAEGNYHDSDGFSGAELLRLAHLATQAYDELGKLRSSDDQGDDANERQ